MDFFSGIDGHLRVLRGVFGKVTADRLASATSRLRDDEVVAVLTEATAVVKAAEAVRALAAGVAAARSTREAGHGGLAQTRGHRTPVSLVQQITGTTRADAAKSVRVGESMLHGQAAPDAAPAGGDAPAPDAGATDTGDTATVPPWHAPLGAALLAGTISTAQHDAILRGLGEPPAGTDDGAGDGTVDPATVEAWRVAAEQLITEAAERTVEELGRAARTIRDALDPAGAQRRFLARYENRAFRTWTDLDGNHHAHITFDDHGYAWVRAVIDAALRPRIGGPRFVDPDETTRADELVADPRTNDQLSYDLILDLLGAGALTDAATVFGVKQPGVRVVRIVTTDTDEAAAGGYVEETGDPIPAAFLNQHTCTIGTSDCTLDQHGNPLYLGREARLYTPKQKIALSLRDGGCRIPGCDRPAHHCEAHHIDEYAKGGRIDIDRGILLCRFHHLNLHHHGWHITRPRQDDFILHRPGEKPVVLKPRIALTWAWAGIDPPPRRFRPAA